MFPQSSTGSAPTPCSRLDRTGREGTLSLAFERRGGRTVLTRRRFTLPLQVLEPMPLDGDGSAYLMLLNPTGGLVGGDHLTTGIVLGAGTHVCLTTTSATKVYRTSGSPAVQEATIRLGERAVLEYLPDHVIPHPGSAFHHSLTVEMDRGSRAILSDAFALGRLARGEQWKFREIVNRLTVMSRGAPLFLDRARLEPSARIPSGLGGMEGFGYVATFLLAGDGFGEWKDLVHAIAEYLHGIPSVRAGVSPIPRGGCFARFLTASAPDLTRTVEALWTLCRHRFLNLPAADIRKY